MGCLSCVTSNDEMSCPTLWAVQCWWGYLVYGGVRQSRYSFTRVTYRFHLAIVLTPLESGADHINFAPDSFI